MAPKGVVIRMNTIIAICCHELRECIPAVIADSYRAMKVINSILIYNINVYLSIIKGAAPNIFFGHFTPFKTTVFRFINSVFL